jgi:hypothetical protein
VQHQVPRREQQQVATQPERRELAKIEPHARIAVPRISQSTSRSSSGSSKKRSRNCGGNPIRL